MKQNILKKKWLFNLMHFLLKQVLLWEWIVESNSALKPIALPNKADLSNEFMFFINFLLYWKMFTFKFFVLKINKKYGYNSVLWKIYIFCVEHWSLYVGSAHQASASYGLTLISSQVCWLDWTKNRRFSKKNCEIL